MVKKILPKKLDKSLVNGGSKKVAVGLSGGVDSSVAALLLKEQGYQVTGVYLQCWDEKADGCSAHEDRSYAVQLAASLDIKFIHLDFKDHYKDTVMKYFYDEYRSGRTPNPDVLCNKEIKFGLFFDWAMSKGFDHVATGHYARVRKEGDRYFLLTGEDISKDQSYFLYSLDQDHLSKILFPIGGMKKDEVRKLARQNHLPTAERPDSTGICFIGEIDVRMFLQKQIERFASRVAPRCCQSIELRLLIVAARQFLEQDWVQALRQ